MRRSALFRQLIESSKILVLPGAHDALSLKLIERAGFQAAAAGGYSATASLIGQPDVAQLGMSDMADRPMSPAPCAPMSARASPLCSWRIRYRPSAAAIWRASR